MSIEYNKYSEELRPKPLKMGQRVTYCIYNTYDKKTGKPTRTLSSLIFPNTDVIYDDHQDKWVPIALTLGRAEDGSPRLIDLIITDQMANLVTVTGGRARDNAIYEYLELCNFNADNPNRDKNQEILIERFDRNSFAKKRRVERAKKREAVQIAEALSDQDVINWHISKQRASNRDMEVLRQEIEDYAEDYPDEFLTSGGEVAVELDELLRTAGKKKIIKFDKAASTWQKSDGKSICTVPKGFNISQYKELANWITNNPEGDDLLTWIKEELKG